MLAVMLMVVVMMVMMIMVVVMMVMMVMGAVMVMMMTVMTVMMMLMLMVVVTLLLLLPPPPPPPPLPPPPLLLMMLILAMVAYLQVEAVQQRARLPQPVDDRFEALLLPELQRQLLEGTQHRLVPVGGEDCERTQDLHALLQQRLVTAEQQRASQRCE